MEQINQLFRRYWDSAINSNKQKKKAVAGYDRLEDVINLYPAFYSTEQRTLSVKNGNTESIITFTPRQFRALTILHEFAHALELLDRDDDAKDRTGTVSEENNRRIFEKCGKVLAALAAD